MLGLVNSRDFEQLQKYVDVLAAEIIELRAAVAELKRLSDKHPEQEGSIPPAITQEQFQRLPWRKQRSIIEAKLRTPDTKNPIEQFTEAQANVHSEKR